MSLKYFFFAAFVFLFFHFLPSEASKWNIIMSPYHFLMGPECYHLKRVKDGGSHQQGRLFGGRATFEHIKSHAVYWGVDGYWAKGTITGKDANKAKIKSNITDSQIEGRLGFNICKHKLRNLMLTPYVVYGYFYGENDFIDPSPVTCHFNPKFQYYGLGFLSSIKLTQCISAGLNFKVNWMYDSKNRITHDCNHDNVTLLMKDETLYEIDLPFKTYWCHHKWIFEGQLTPFYRFRHYGSRENFPFDFIGTRFYIYGIRLLLGIIF